MSKICMGCMEQYDDEYEVCPYCGYIEGTKDEDALHIEPGEIIHDRYIVGRAIGFGGFGVTYIGWDALLEHKVAIKEYMPSEFSTRALGTKEVTIFGGKKAEQFDSGLKKFHEEAKKLAKFNTDDGIVRVYDSFEENNTAYIIMELLEGETLSAFLEREKSVSIDKAISIILPIAEALKSVHADGVIHRDIAPDNIFLTNDGKVKLIDFGAARFATTSHSRSLSVLIKQGYSPEEQSRSRGDQGPYTDVYALGAVMYRMVTGATPPDALERRAYFENKKKDILTPISKYVKDIPENKQNAILNAMNVRIEDRTQNAEEFIKELTTDEPVKRKKGKIKAIDFFSWPLWAKITFPTAAAIVLTLSILFVTGVIGFKNNIQKEIYIPDGMARVPSIVNTKLDNAEGRLDKAGLLYSISGKKYSTIVPADLILTQSIDGGAVVVNNTVIEIEISAGSDSDINLEEMPDLQFRSEEEVIELLKKYNITPNISYETSETVKLGLVIKQEPAAGTPISDVKQINITISKGGTAFAMPDVVGKSEQEARDLLNGKGLSVTVDYDHTSDEIGVVLRQSIKPNDNVYRGTSVTITVNSGEELIDVPDLTGKSKSEAEDILTSAGFKVEFNQIYDDTIASGNVVSQSPTANSSQRKGSKVLLSISKGRQPISVPNVTGYSQDVADSTLKSLGLNVSVETSFDDSVPVGNVISQSPSAGNNLYKGDTVKITVSRGKDKVNIPSVVGLNESEAAGTLGNVGLNIQVSSEYNETIAKGVVIKQNPESGSAYKGDTIQVIVSNGKEPISIVDYTGSSESSAKNGLSSAGFEVVTVQEYSSSVPSGNVIYQQPSSGTGYRGDTITLTISKGKEIILPSSVSLSETSIKIYTSGNNTSKQLNVTISPSNADDKSVTWSSSNTKVATVSSNGLVKAVGEGTAVITVKTNSAGKTATCNVTVKPPYTNYGAWSGWSTTPISSTELREVETKQELVYTGWGGWSGWSTNSVSSNDLRQVETKNEQYVESYEMNYWSTRTPSYERQFRNYSINGDYSGYGVQQSYGEHHYGSLYVTPDELNSATVIPPGGSQGGSQNGVNKTNQNGYALNDGYATYIYFIINTNYGNATYYRYRERSQETVTYYRYRERSKN